MSDRILDPDGINTSDRLDKPVDGDPIPIRHNGDDDVIPSPDDTPPPQPTDTPPPDEAPPKKDDNEPTTPDVPQPIDEPNMPLPPLV